MLKRFILWIAIALYTEARLKAAVDAIMVTKINEGKDKALHFVSKQFAIPEFVLIAYLNK